MLQAVRLLTEMVRTSDDRSREDGSDPQASTSTAEAPVVFREIHKNGWLRRTDAGKPDGARYWVAFCVHDDADPRLEGFPDQKQATSHNPVWSQSLRTTLHLSPTLCATSKNDYEFCVNFNDDQILRLAAPTYQTMLDWVQVVTRKLTDMRIVRPKENLYSRGPERIATRDPTSPLPPPPLSLGSRLPQSSSPSTLSTPNVFTFDDIPAEERRPPSRQPSHRSTSHPPASPRFPSASTSNGDTGNSSYESVFLAQSGESARNNNSNAGSSSDEGEQYAALIEYRTSSDNAPENASSTTNVNANLTSTVSPPPTVATSQSRRPAGQQLTLREQQVLQLRKEMSHPAGVRLKLGRRDCKDGIAFVDCFGAVWIAGWKHKEHPLLYNVLHIGDLVLSVGGVQLTGASSVKEILKNYTFPRIEMIVRRLPHGRVTTLNRRMESEDFGLEVNSANEVTSVSPSAQALGLSSIANPADPSADVGTTVTWTLTEVNNRPLSLYESSARERMNALGRDVSVVLQPSDLVNAMRKKLRTVRGYKSFVLQ
ncbi:uncharacterized protein LOC131669979 [Phymastichus coffea]|uniref:uncharacterized protein LOC131669979 n=1 Tax=Phymastichus coffea TaxID=108790 RepID=UPI00273AC0B8|nr:uncharacterized protein LOC131669979 [Phymastichus coffea]XP_058801215.1 uncharacterized protein LOC131669979 [Phymastichus coffea]